MYKKMLLSLAVFLLFTPLFAHAEQISVYIYYTVPDRAFEFAAQHKASQENSSIIKEYVSVRTRNDFINAWNQIKERAENNQSKIVRVSLFTHSSKGDKIDGLEFGDIFSPSTLTRDDIMNLKKLPWSNLAPIIELHGCNTGLVGSTGWAPAEAFVLSQGVQSCGETGFAYFSTDPNTYREKAETDKKIYLYAYKRKLNAPLGNGSRMPRKCFNP